MRSLLVKPTSDIAQGRILVRGVNWLGDAVMTTPALLRLRAAVPDAHITLLTAEKLRDLWRGHPAVDEVMTFAPGDSVLTASRRLRRGRYTHALVLPNSPRSALEVFLAGIPHRIGYARAWRSRLLTQPIAGRPAAVTMHKRSVEEIKELVAAADAARPIPAQRGREEEKAATAQAGEQAAVNETVARAHQIHEYLYLVAALGADPRPLAPRLKAAPFASTGLARFFTVGSQRMNCVIGLNPGAEYGPAKRWPVESFATAANELYRRLDCEFLIFGGPADVALADQLRAQMRAPLAHGHVTSLAGKTKLGELMAALKACRVLITNDTGPMHVAAALGTPVVAPFGSTSPVLTGPGLPGDPRQRLLVSDAPCAPCFRRECPVDFRCLRGISAERVVWETLAAIAASK